MALQSGRVEDDTEAHRGRVARHRSHAGGGDSAGSGVGTEGAASRLERDAEGTRGAVDATEGVTRPDLPAQGPAASCIPLFPASHSPAFLMHFVVPSSKLQTRRGCGGDGDVCASLSLLERNLSSGHKQKRWGWGRAH